MILVVDCYLNEQGGAPNFIRQLEGRAHQVTRPPHESLPEIDGWSAVIITGSAACLANGYEGEEHHRSGWSSELVQWTRRAVDAGTPVLGVCFGHQVLGAAFGAPVRKAAAPEGGFKRVVVHTADPLFDRLGSSFITFLSHEDEVVAIPELQLLASTPDCAVQSFRVPGRQAWGVQFHTEMQPPEIEELLLMRREKHGLAMDVAMELAQIPEAAEVAPKLFGRFLELTIPMQQP